MVALIASRWIAYSRAPASHVVLSGLALRFQPRCGCPASGWSRQRSAVHHRAQATAVGTRCGTWAWPRLVSGVRACRRRDVWSLEDPSLGIGAGEGVTRTAGVRWGTRVAGDPCACGSRAAGRCRRGRRSGCAAGVSVTHFDLCVGARQVGIWQSFFNCPKLSPFCQMEPKVEHSLELA